MRVETASDAKNRFGEVMDAALRAPVVIRRSGRNAVVMLAYEDYEALVALVDRQWAEKASHAKGKGMTGAAKSERLLNRLLHAED
jgi:antitoxin Phd